ncbi:DUF4174 domain-containing protein [Tropicimonas sp. IMCC6043]|uniref:DUF4174 domain-containing protein n=1 Tax=Tropicimonas sp. IMCC6043 TaxID=2510645 RepID=UPI00101C15D1|nr:DUF4174 domain-containing protein [Tropicimonas sp. IMCC6043]RYH10718.1 DUF4174 domain-containing protein [Tropicimonas sp. IMCC6043]
MPIRLLLAAVLAALPFAVPAQEAAAAEGASDPAGLQILPAEGVEIDEFLWVNRVLVVFADTPADPRFIEQMKLITERPRDLLEREVVVVVDTAPKDRSAVRKELRPRGFALVLVDKDGGVKLRKPLPWSTREIARSIDKTPLRRDEIRSRSGSIGQ